MLKIFVNFIMIFVLGIFFSGCAGVTVGKVAYPVETEPKTGMKYEVLKTNEGDYAIRGSISAAGSKEYHKFNEVLSGYDIKTAKAAQRKKEVLTAVFNAAARATKKMGYNYFVVTNPELSGFSGFPINNFNQLIKYVTIEDRKPTFDTLDPYNSFNYRNLITRHGEVTLRFVPVPKKIYDSGLYAVWKVSDFI